MSVSTAFSDREAYPVRIGALVLYCEKFRAAGTRAFAEKSTVSGDTFFSNTDKKALRFTLEGRILDEYVPLRFLIYANGFMKADSAFEIEYRGLKFTDCHVQAFTAEDDGEDYIKASITLVTTNMVQPGEAVQNEG